MLLQLGAAVAEAAEAVEADRTGQRVPRLALVQFGRCLPPQVGQFQPVEREQGALDAADLPQGQRQAVLAWVGAEALEHQRGAHRAGPDRRREAEHVLPVGGDQLVVGGARDERREGGPGTRRPEGIEPALGQVGNARRKAETQQVREAEDLVADAVLSGLAPSGPFGRPG